MEFVEIFTLWIGIALTLMSLSFVIKESFFYRIAEYTLIGGATAQFAVLAVIRLMTYSTQAFGGEYILLVGLFIIGPSLFFVFSEKYAWVARYGMALLLGAGVGFSLRGLVTAQIVTQLKAIISGPFTSPSLLTNLNSYYILFGSICILSFFIFTERFTKGNIGKVWKNTGRIGKMLMMIAMGAYIGNAYMRWISLLLARIRFVLSAFT